MKLTIPAQLHESDVFGFADQLRAVLRNEEEISLDFSTITFAKPLGTILLAAVIRNAVNYRKRRGHRTLHMGVIGIERTAQVISYLKHIGFFHHINLPIGLEPGMAAGSATYLPITILTRRMLTQSLHGDGDYVQDEIRRRSIELAKKVLRTDLYTRVAPLAYCFTEVIRNVFEHSNSDSCVLCAQRWTEHQTIEIAILDQGIGIPASLSERFTFDSDYEALQLAVKSGVTSKPSGDANADWVNGGHGLYALTELARHAGEMVIVSGDSGLRVAHYDHSGKEMKYEFKGTAVKLSVQKMPGVDMAELLKTILEKCDVDIDRITSVRNRSSRMLPF